MAGNMSLTYTEGELVDMFVSLYSLVTLSGSIGS